MSAYLAAQPRETAGASGTAPRLFCFHHAGAGALTFARWRRAFAPDVTVLPVRLPGRETRLREPRITEAAVLLAELDDQLGPLLTEPYAFYGHSLGALVAHRFAQHRQSAGHAPPALVGLGACQPPHLPAPLTAAHHGLDDGALLAALGRYGALPPSLFERPRWLRAFLSTMRDDLRLAAGLREGTGLRHGTGERLACPVHAFAGSEDGAAPAPAVEEWRRWTSGPFTLRTVAGGHFFVRDAELPGLLAAELRHRIPGHTSRTPHRTSHHTPHHAHHSTRHRSPSTTHETTRPTEPTDLSA